MGLIDNAREGLNSQSLLLKVCGMTDIGEIMNLDVDHVGYIGFIFYEPSPRNAFNVSCDDIKLASERFKTVGVFVDMPTDEIVDICSMRNITTVQLHGNESPQMCIALSNRGLEVIKALRLNEDDINTKCQDYDGIVRYFLFDTAGKRVGGNGVKFDWNLLKKYTLKTPFILSGGIGPDDVPLIKENIGLKKHGMEGIDINSCFETSPGHKDINKINYFIDKLFAHDK